MAKKKLLEPVKDEFYLGLGGRGRWGGVSIRRPWRRCCFACGGRKRASLWRDSGEELRLVATDVESLQTTGFVVYDCLLVVIGYFVGN